MIVRYVNRGELQVIKELYVSAFYLPSSTGPPFILPFLATRTMVTTKAAMPKAISKTICQVTVHCLMSVIVSQAQALATGSGGFVRKVA